MAILLVDDSARIRSLVRAILSDLGSEIVEAENAQRALQLAEAQTAPIDLLVTDLAMPGMSGIELAEALHGRYPTLKVLCMSGYSLPTAPAEYVHFIEKPFRPDELLRKVRSLFESD